MKKKILTITLCVAMLAITITGVTLAYFSDTESKTNTFTVGSVDIELIESQFHRVVDSVNDNDIKADSATYDDYLADQGKNIVPGRKIRKAPYVVNQGKNDAFIRVRLIIPADLFNPDGIHVMITTTAINEGAITGPTQLGSKVIDGVTYNEYAFVYTKALAPGEMTYWPAFWEVGLDTTCTSQTIEKLIADGVITSDGKFNIVVEADAIQAESFSDAAAAFAAFDAQN